MERYLVGGMIRDQILGVDSKDFDFTVTLEANEIVNGDPFQTMVDELEDEGFEIFVKNPQFFTVRARFPKKHANRGVVADFVLARKESGYSDSRRPDSVEVGTLMDDLARRDFTMNAVAQSERGNFIDPFGGISDIRDGIIRTVGNPMERFSEDPLRILRALRFSITKDMTLDLEVARGITATTFMIRTVAVERVYEEVNKMLIANQAAAFAIFDVIHLMPLFFDMGINFRPTLGK